MADATPAAGPAPGGSPAPAANPATPRKGPPGKGFVASRKAPPSPGGEGKAPEAAGGEKKAPVAPGAKKAAPPAGKTSPKAPGGAKSPGPKAPGAKSPGPKAPAAPNAAEAAGKAPGEAPAPGGPKSPAPGPAKKTSPGPGAAKKSPGAPGTGKKSPGPAGKASPGPPTTKGPAAPPAKTAGAPPAKGPSDAAPKTATAPAAKSSPSAPPAKTGPIPARESPLPAAAKSPTPAELDRGGPTAEPSTQPAASAGQQPPAQQPAGPAIPVQQPASPASQAQLAAQAPLSASGSGTFMPSAATGTITNTAMTGVTAQQPASYAPMTPLGGGRMMNSSFGAGMSPIPMTTSMRAESLGNLSASGRAALARKEKRPSKLPPGPLTVDPRSGLALIDIPREREQQFAHLGKDMLLHIFMDVDRISSKAKPLRRVLFVTDTTLFICEETGGVSRCLQVSKISMVHIATDTSNEVALVIPSEYDIILRLDKREQRDDLIVVLRAVYKRMVDEELSIRQVKEIVPKNYNKDRPSGFTLQMIPQRSREALKRALEAEEQQQDERETALDRVRTQLDGEHKAEVAAKQQELTLVQARLDKTMSRLRMQTDELEKLRAAYSKQKKRVEEIESQFGAQGEAPASKDAKIRELQDVVETLTASVAKANEERSKLEAARRAGDFLQLDLDHVEVEQPRLRGRSLHQQGMIEVLERQLELKKQELGELAARQVDVQKLNLDLHRKEEVLKELEQQVQAARGSDPINIYGGPSVAQIMGDTSPPERAASSRSLGASTYMDPLLGLDKHVVAKEEDLSYDEEGEPMMGFGSIKKQAVTLSLDLPEYRLPADERNFVVDPRTGLSLLNVPEAYREPFKDAVGTIIHFFAAGTKLNKRGHEQRRVMLVSDIALSLCSPAGSLNRCMYIAKVREVQMDRDGNVALLLDGRSEYDLAIRFESVDVCEQLVTVLRRCSTFLKRQPPLKVTYLERISHSDLKLEKPATWEFQAINPRTKHSLYEALQALSKSSAEERRKIREASEGYQREIIAKLKEEMRGEIDVRQQREFAVLRQQLATMDARLRERQLEVRNLRRQMADHRCSVEHVKLTQNTHDLYETQGMYWIPTDPVVMECELEILHIQFHDNFVVTSHPNGFLNVWDINTADLYRTLKTNGHTARVTAFHFDGRDLVSGGHDSSLRRWNIMEGACIRVVPGAHKGIVSGVQFDATRLVTSGGDGVINLWDISSMKHTKALRGHKGAITCFKFERNMLASAEWGWIFAWDIDKGIILKALRDDNGGITCLDLCDTNLISGGSGGVLTVWHLNTGESDTLEGHTDDIQAVQLQKNFAISSSSDCTIRMWNVQEMIPLGIFHNSYPYEARKFHFKANRFVVGENRTIKVWTR